jgi:hypothetical protein
LPNIFFFLPLLWAIPTWPWLVVSMFKNFVRSIWVWWDY